MEDVILAGIVRPGAAGPRRGHAHDRQPGRALPIDYLASGDPADVPGRRRRVRDQRSAGLAARRPGELLRPGIGRERCT
ncbi:hypothetical protein HBB16_08875 [Pseudonocardia sp. MCCB 268]|nr:hypothetical protein [Pseudonocardia cytotoxica]